MKRIFYILAVVLSIVACTEEIDESNRYTFTGETVADYLQNRSEKYSHFTNMLKRANLMGLLSTYGQYTLFLPDNDAVEKFLYEQDSIYQSSKNSNKVKWTGVTSPYFEDVSDSMANVIARTHLIQASIRTPEMREGSLRERNFYYRLLGVNFVVKDEQYYIMINNNAAIINGDNYVENGVIHRVDKVISLSDKNVPDLIDSYSFFTLFAEAMNRTGFCDSLQLDRDDSYNSAGQSFLTIPGTSYYRYAPETRFYKYTAFIETDDVFRENGIYTIEDLIAFAEKWYGKEEKDNFKNPNNALYKFVSYHFVTRELPHNKIVPYGIRYETVDFDNCMPTLYDRYDYYETMQGTLMKVVRPYSMPDGGDTYINYSKRSTPYNQQLTPHLNVRVIPLTEFVSSKNEYSHFNQMANNGIMHPIDKILIYNEDEMYGNILNERIRIDIFSLIPELSSNNIRYNIYSAYYMPNDYSEKVNCRSGSIILANFNGNYNGDCMSLYGLFDIEFTLPPLPPRVYEVRLGFDVQSSWYEQEVQTYIDGFPVGSVFDLRCEDTGRVEDINTFDNGVENDKHMRNLGWMKAPVIFVTLDRYGSARHDNSVIRRIITKHYFSSGRHKIRFRYLGEINKGAAEIDYLEFVPLRVISDPFKPEDRY